MSKLFVADDDFGPPLAWDVGPYTAQTGGDGYHDLLGDGYVGHQTNKIALTTTPIEIALQPGAKYRLHVDTDCLAEFICLQVKWPKSGRDSVTDDTGFMLVADVTEEIRVQKHRETLSIMTVTGTGNLRIHKVGHFKGYGR